MPQPPAPQPTKGALHSVPCPFCKRPMDFRAYMGEEGGGVGWGAQGLEIGSLIDCDHCNRRSKVLSIDRVTVIRLTPV